MACEIEKSFMNRDSPDCREVLSFCHLARKPLGGQIVLEYPVSWDATCDVEVAVIGRDVFWETTGKLLVRHKYTVGFELGRDREGFNGGSVHWARIVLKKKKMLKKKKKKKMKRCWEEEKKKKNENSKFLRMKELSLHNGFCQFRSAVAPPFTTFLQLIFFFPFPIPQKKAQTVNTRRRTFLLSCLLPYDAT